VISIPSIALVGNIITGQKARAITHGESWARRVRSSDLLGWRAGIPRRRVSDGGNDRQQHHQAKDDGKRCEDETRGHNVLPYYLFTTYFRRWILFRSSERKSSRAAPPK
jgi:hypothetical protein